MGIGLFGDCQSTNLRPVNHYFPQIARRTGKMGADVFTYHINFTPERTRRGKYRIRHRPMEFGAQQVHHVTVEQIVQAQLRQPGGRDEIEEFEKMTKHPLHRKATRMEGQLPIARQIQVRWPPRTITMHASGGVTQADAIETNCHHRYQARFHHLGGAGQEGDTQSGPRRVAGHAG